MNMNENKYMEGYVAPVLEVIEFELENMIVTSPCPSNCSSNCSSDNPEGYIPDTPGN